MPRLVALLGELGLAVSKRQVARLLLQRPACLEEAQAVLRAGLETARWITVDDTGARHKGRNGVCTQIGDERFTAFKTTASKSRLNVLEVLRAGYGDYVVNAAALACAIARLAAHPRRHFATQAA